MMNLRKNKVKKEKRTSRTNELANLEMSRSVNPRKTSLRIVLIYFLLGVLWITSTDRMINLLIKDPGMLLNLQIYKGWIFVLVTSMVFYTIILDKLKLCKEAGDKIYQTYNELLLTHKRLVDSEEILQKQVGLLRESRENLLSSNQRYEAIVDGSNDGIWHWDLKSGESFFSIPYKENFGFSIDDPRSSRDLFLELIGAEDHEENMEIFKRHANNKDKTHSHLFKLKDKQGGYRWIISRGSIKYDDSGEAIFAAGSHTDITKEKKMEERLYKLAYYDNLTNLPNKTYLKESVEGLISEEEEKRILGLAYLEIKNFKRVNESMGYSTGDELIRYIGRTITDLIGRDNQLFRLGIDEYGILFIDKSKEEISGLIKSIIAEAEKPWVFANNSLQYELSVGLAIYPRDGEDFESLIQKANIASSYTTDKMSGYSFYSQAMLEEAKKAIEIHNELDMGMENKEFQVFYQPQVDLKSEKIIGAEALIRWFNPRKGLIMPLDFIPHAERSGKIRNLCKFVFSQVCKDINEWTRKDYPIFKIAVNLSVETIMYVNLLKEMEEILSEYQIGRSSIEIEITETTIMANIEKSIRLLEDIRELGLTVALDDFGTGYSSLNYIKELPVDLIKIDRMFIKEIGKSEKSSFIIKTIIDLAHGLGIKVLAEGIETKEELEFLREYNCDYGQGFYFYRPMPVEDLEKLLKK